MMWIFYLINLLLMYLILFLLIFMYLVTINTKENENCNQGNKMFKFWFWIWKFIQTPFLLLLFYVEFFRQFISLFLYFSFFLFLHRFNLTRYSMTISFTLLQVFTWVCICISSPSSFSLSLPLSPAMRWNEKNKIFHLLLKWKQLHNDKRTKRCNGGATHAMKYW